MIVLTPDWRLVRLRGGGVHGSRDAAGKSCPGGFRRVGSNDVMTNVAALNREFAKYDQVRKAHAYRLAEHEGDLFDEDYEIATLDFARFLKGGAAERAAFAKEFADALGEIGFAV